jgi:hypothetical protein
VLIFIRLEEFPIRVEYPFWEVFPNWKCFTVGKRFLRTTIWRNSSQRHQNKEGYLLEFRVIFSPYLK